MNAWRGLLLVTCLAGAAVADDLDPADNSERVLLLLPKGPLLVELHLTIDEQPYRLGSERLLDSLLKAADADDDGQLTWDEVASARSLGGSAASPAQFDSNQNGLVEKDEARRAFATLTGGGTFAVQGQAFLGGRLDTARLQQLFDADDNGQLSDEEIAAAPARLRSRDADDNEIVTMQELAGFNIQNDRNGARAMAAFETILALDRATDWKQLHATLTDRYGKSEVLAPAAFQLSRELGETLDTSGDGQIAADELAALGQADAPLVLDVALGTRTRLRDTVKVVSMAEELKRIARIDRSADGKLLIDLISLRIEILAPNPKPTPRTFAGQATAYVVNYDKDKNGYLEREELAGATVAAQFDAWDGDGNGRVFPDEIRLALERVEMPNWQKISVAALSQGSSLFAQLDDNSDGQLGVREVRSASDRLATLELDEYETMRLAIARGSETYKYLSKGTNFNRRVRNATAAPGDGPAWFTHMDTNGDGDITEREFLGTREQFEELDTNADSVIASDEAASP